VYVGNIRDDVRERDVEKFFKGFGGLREITLKNGFGFVEFEDDRDADDACHDLDGKDLMGGRVRVELARERGRGGDRGDLYLPQKSLHNGECCDWCQRNPVQIQVWAGHFFM